MCFYEIVDMLLLSKILFLNVMLFLSKIKNCLYCLYCL